jgi:exodeoxyribonuclease VII large subunit
VADARASTPSNAAEIAVPDQAELLRWLQDAQVRMSQAEDVRLQRLRQKLNGLAEKRVMTDQLAYVQDKRMDLVHVQQRLGDLAGVFLGQKKQQFAALAASLDAMSPLKVLGRGYAMAQNESGQILRSYRDVEPGERVKVTLGEGGFSCTIEEPLKEECR